MLSKLKDRSMNNWRTYGASVKFSQQQKRGAQLSSTITPLQIWSKEQTIRRLQK